MTDSALTAVSLRPATVDDATAWADFLAEAQIRTYADLAPADFAERRRAEAGPYAAQLAVEFAASDPAWVRIIAEHEGRIAGVVAAGPGPLAWEIKNGYDAPPAARQLERLYLHPDWHGTGLADRLLADVLDDRPIYLWLIDGNLRAQRFYRRHGFVDLPEQLPAGPAFGGVAMHRMLRAAS